MSARFQVTFDARDPARLARFWAEALGYVRQPPPPGYESWQQFGEHVGLPPEKWDAYDALVDPDGTGPRLFFQRVPEGKTAKNRVHLDVAVGNGQPDPDRRRTEVRERAAQLVEGGAAVRHEIDEPHGWCVVMTDPEGKEFCLQ